MKFHAYSEKLATFLECNPKNSPSPQLPVADQRKIKTGRCPVYTIY